jgi:PAS domain S-box-containing protein
MAAKPALILCRLDDGSFVKVNKAFADMIGYSVEETLNLSFWHLTPQTYEKEEQVQLANLKSEKGEYGPYQKVYIHKDGHKFPVYLQGIRIRIGGTDYSWSHVAEGILEGELIDMDQVSDNPIRSRDLPARDLDKPIKAP